MPDYLSRVQQKRDEALAQKQREKEIKSTSESFSKVTDAFQKMNMLTFMASKDEWFTKFIQDLKDLSALLEKVTENVNKKDAAFDSNFSKKDALFEDKFKAISKNVDETLKRIESINVRVDSDQREVVDKLIEVLNRPVKVLPPNVTVKAPDIDFKPLETAIVKALTPKPQAKAKKALDMSGFVAHDLDNAPDGRQYIGFADSLGNWFIKECDDENNKERYFFGKMDYEQAWGDRYGHDYKTLGEALS